MELTIEQALQQGVAAHNSGDLQEADRAYQAILQSQPKHPDANHNLGLIAISVNQIEAALPLFKTALEANPKIEQFWVSYIDALLKAKHLKDAKQAIKKAKKKGFDVTKLQVLFSQSKVNTDTKVPSQQQLSSLLEYYQNGRLSDAEKLATFISHEFPSHNFSWKILAAVFKATGRNSEAVNANQTAVALSPQDAEAHYNLGNTLNELGRLGESEASYRQAIALKPDYIEAYSNLGYTLKELGRLDEAEASLRQAIELKPDFAEAHSNLGATLQELGRLEEAEASYRQAIELKPDFAEAHSNLGNTLNELGRLGESEASYRQAIALKPDYIEAYRNLGNTLKELGRLDEAEASLRQAIVLKPDYAEAHYNLGDVYKKIGKHSKAVECFEKVLELSSEDFLGATLQLASLGKRKIPDKTPEKYMQEFYRKKSKRWGDLDKKQDKYRGHLLIENAFKITHNPSKQVEILDLGCGTGSLARTLRPYARTLVGVDLSPDMLFKAKEIGLYDLLYKKDLNQYLGEILNHYDTVVAAAVLIHFFNLDDIFFLVRESLKVNGRFIFSIFEETQKNRDLNSFLMYSHSDDYVTELADRLNLKIIYRQKDTHEYHRGIPVTAIIYVLEKLS